MVRRGALRLPAMSSHHDTMQATVLLTSDRSAGAIGIVEVSVPPRWEGPPLHHHDFDEAFRVLDGELTFQLGDELVTRRAGDLVFAPRGSAHTFANLADAPARYLLICTPGGFERMFSRVIAEQDGVEPTTEALLPYPPTVVVGPRIGDR